MSIITYKNHTESGRSYFISSITRRGIELSIGRDSFYFFETVIANTSDNKKSLNELELVISALSVALDTHADFHYRVKKEIEFAFGQEFSEHTKNDSIENNFSYHAPKKGQPELYELIRSEAKALAYLLHESVPDGREKSLAMTKLEEAVFWANAGIARS